MRRLVLVVAVLVAARSSAQADESDHVTGFTTYGTGELVGRVTGPDDKPVAGAVVHIAGKASEQTVTTDANGAFHVVLPGTDTVTVFVRGTVHINGRAIVPAAGSGDMEVVEIHETIPPAVLPKPISSATRILDYTDEAIDANAWTRAWLILDVDATGSVGRLKLLKRPGFGLDATAIREGLKLKFEPARDRANRPVGALVVWLYEWPSYWWMQSRHLNVYEMSSLIQEVPCRDKDPNEKRHRDCSQPDIAHGLGQPWVDKPPR